MRLASATVLILVAVPLIFCASMLSAEGKKKAPLPPGTKIDLNSASKEELMKLPGVGSRMADDIITGRPYSSIDDLTKVKGIGEKKIERLRPNLSLGKEEKAPSVEVKEGKAPAGEAAAPKEEKKIETKPMEKEAE